jgi:hypothetical protein
VLGCTVLGAVGRGCCRVLSAARNRGHGAASGPARGAHGAVRQRPGQGARHGVGSASRHVVRGACVGAARGRGRWLGGMAGVEAAARPGRARRREAGWALLARRPGSLERAARSCCGGQRRARGGEKRESQGEGEEAAAAKASRGRRLGQGSGRFNGPWWADSAG